MARCSRMWSICTRWPERRSSIQMSDFADDRQSMWKCHSAAKARNDTSQVGGNRVRLGKHCKQVAQVVLVGRIAKQRCYPKNFLDGAQGRAVRVMDKVLVAMALGKR